MESFKKIVLHDEGRIYIFRNEVLAGLMQIKKAKNRKLKVEIVIYNRNEYDILTALLKEAYEMHKDIDAFQVRFVEE